MDERVSEIRELRAHIVILQNTVEDRERNLERAHALIDEQRARAERAEAALARLERTDREVVVAWESLAAVEKLNDQLRQILVNHGYDIVKLEKITAALTAAADNDDADAT